MNDKLYNLIQDPNVHFYLLATAKLKEYISAGSHPLLQKLRADVKAELLAGNVLILDKDDVYQYATGALDPAARFLFSTGEIRVVGMPSIKL